MRPIDGFPTSWGSSRASLFPHSGPSNYVQVTYAPVAHGDEVVGQEAGLGAIQFVNNGVSDSGSFQVLAIPESSSVGTTGTATNKYRLRWMALRTASIGGQNQVAGTEAIAGSDLSGEVVRLLAIGPK